MSGVLLLKEKAKSFYGKNDMFINPLAKFLLTLITLCMINSNIGYMGSINNFFVVMIISVMGAILPIGATVLLETVVIVAHLFSLSMELAAVTLIVFLIFYLLCFRISSKHSVWVVITLLCFMFKVPYVVPVAAGLLATMASIVPVCFGVVIYYIINFAKEYEKVIETAETSDMFDNFLTVINGVLDKEIILVALSFSLTIAIVYVIRRLSIDYSWIYAIVAGALTDFVMLLVGNVIFGTDIGFVGILIGLFLAILVGYVINIFFFGVDYSRTERVQYEDDEYYYYVKAVPKYSVTVTDVKVKKINTQKKKKVERDYDDFDEIDINF